MILSESGSTMIFEVEPMGMLVWRLKIRTPYKKLSQINIGLL